MPTASTIWNPGCPASSRASRRQVNSIRWCIGGKAPTPKNRGGADSLLVRRDKSLRCPNECPADTRLGSEGLQSVGLAAPEPHEQGRGALIAPLPSSAGEEV